MSFITDLKRRRVLQTAGIYGVTAFGITEILTFVFENFGVPLWANRLVASLFVAGFPVAMFLSWVFDVQAGGRIERSRFKGQSTTPIVTAAMVLMVAATGGLFYLIFPRAEQAAGQIEAVEAQAPDNSVAVLAFSDMSPDQDQEYFADGLSDTLIHVLAQVSGLKVTAKTSSFYFKGKDVTIEEIAGKLEVAHILAGSIQKAGNRIRVLAQLIKASDGTHVWSKNFDRDLKDIFAVQDEIANAVAAEFVGDHNEGVTPIESRRTTPEVYAMVLQARHLSRRRAAPDIDQATELLTRAIDADPTYAPAHSEMAHALYFSTIYGASSLDDLRLRIEEKVDTALNLDPNDAMAYAIRANLWPFPEEADKSLADLEHSLELNPNNVEVMTWLADRLGGFEGVELRRRAYEIDPLNVQVRSEYAIQVLVVEGDTDKAIAIAEETITLKLNPARALKTLAGLNVVGGRLGAVTRVYFESARIDPESPLSYYQVANWLGFLGEAELSNKWFEIAVELRPSLKHTTHNRFRTERGEAGALLRETEQRLAADPQSLKIQMEIFTVAAELGNYDRAIQAGEAVLGLADDGFFQKYMGAGLHLYGVMAMIYRHKDQPEEKDYFTQKFMTLAEARMEGDHPPLKFAKFYEDLYMGMVSEDYDAVAKLLEKMPLANPILYSHLNLDAYWAPALENENVRKWSDDFRKKITQAREDIRSFEDPAFWDPRLLLAAVTELPRYPED